MLPEYRSTTYLDYSDPAHDAGMREALALVRSQAGAAYPLVIGGKRIETKERFQSFNPADPAESLGTFSKGGAEHVPMAVEAASKAFLAWAALPAEERANVLLRAAGILRRRRHEMSATMVLEVGKSWAEADGDTDERILITSSAPPIRSKSSSRVFGSVSW
jgi:1-pyrroline-5-carboxylate dehydrogenase